MSWAVPAEMVSDVLIAEGRRSRWLMCRGLGCPVRLDPFVAGFAAELSRQGYKPQPVGKQVGLVALLRLMKDEAVGPERPNVVPFTRSIQTRVTATIPRLAGHAS